MTGYAGEHIGTFVARAIAAATESGLPTACEFNGAAFEVTGGDSVETAQAKWQAAFDENGRKYRESPEGIAAAKEQAEREIRTKSLAHDLAREAGSIRWDDIECTLAFLERCVDPLGFTYTAHLNFVILPFLEQAGYEASAFCGDEFKNDRETFARWLIGQAMHGMQLGMGIHQVYSHFYAQWLERFRNEAAQ